MRRTLPRRAAAALLTQLLCAASALQGCATTQGAAGLRQEALAGLDDPSQRDRSLDRLVELDLLEDAPQAALDRASSASPSPRARLSRALAADARGDVDTAVAEMSALAMAPTSGADGGATLALPERRVALHWFLSNLDLAPAELRPEPGDPLAARLLAQLRATEGPRVSACVQVVPTPTPRVDVLAGRPLPNAPCQPSPVEGGLALGNTARARYRARLGPFPTDAWVRVRPPEWARVGDVQTQGVAAVQTVGAGGTLVVEGLATTPSARLEVELLPRPPGAAVERPRAADASGDWAALLADALDAEDAHDVARLGRLRSALILAAPRLAAARLLGEGTRSTLTHGAFQRRSAEANLRAGRGSAARRQAEALAGSRDLRDVLLAARIFSDLGVTDASRQALARAERLAPASCAPARLRLESDLEAIKLGQPLTLPAAHGKRCEDDPRVRELLAAAAAETGRVRLESLAPECFAADGAAALPASCPAEARALDGPTRLRLLERTGHRDQALALAEAMAAATPADPARWESLASLLLLSGDAAEAEAASLRTWRAEQGDADARLVALARGVGRELLGLAGSVEDALARPVPPELLEGRSAAVLLDHATTIRFADGRGLQHVRQVMRLLDHAALESFGEAEVPSNGILLDAATHKADGRRLVPESFDRKETVSFPALEPGDAIVLEYLVPLVPDGFLGGGYLESPFYLNLFDVPVLDSTYLVLSPKQRGATLVAEGADVTPYALPEQPLFEGFEAQRVQKLSSPGVTGEPEAASPLGALSQARVVCLGAANAPCAPADVAVRELLFEAALGLTPPDDRVTEWAQRLADATPDAELVPALWRAVRDEVEEDEGAWLSVAAGDAITAGRGERAIVLWALARAAGLDASLVLARPVDGGGTALDGVNPRSFSERLVRVVDRQGTSWLLDPEYARLEPGFVSPRVWGQPAVAMSAREVQPWVVPAGGKSDQRTVRVSLTVEESGALTGVWRETSRGGDAMAWRNARAGLPKDKWRDAVASLLEPVLSGAELDDFSVDGLDDDGAIHAELRFHRGARAGVELTLLPVELASRWGTLDARNTAMLLDLNVDIDLSLEVRGSGLESAPPVSAVFAGASYARRVEPLEGGVRVVRQLKVRPQRVEPGAYAAFRDFAVVVDQADTVTLR